MNTVGHYIFVANDIPLVSRGSVSATHIADVLLSQEFWAFSPHTPVQSKLKPQDRILIYLAGPSRRHFVAEALLASHVFDANESHKDVLGSLGITYFSKIVALKQIRRFDSPIPIAPLVHDLHFIRNKRYYGHHLRHAIIRIPERDFDLIVSKTKASCSS